MSQDKILEWCGWKYYDFGVQGWIPPDDDSKVFQQPILDMNFLGKYVIPKIEVYWIEATNEGHHLSFYGEDGKFYSSVNKNLNTACQEALIKLIKATG